MKIVKRDGRTVEYDADKIRVAINKANEKVADDARATEKQINNIIKYIEGLKKKRMLVEDIQDIIEQKLMDLGKYDLAKEYIIYRYTRALVRKSNTTDELILSLIRNNNNENFQNNINKKPYIASTQRDLIAAEVSKDLSARILLPEKIAKAHEQGVIHFHDTEYFLQPLINSSYINIEDMLENGTAINSKLIESPKGFQVACTITTQIIAAIATGQYGRQALNINCLGKYLKISYEKIRENLSNKYTGELSGKQIEELTIDRLKEELTAGVQTIQYQINTLITSNGRIPYISFYLDIEENDIYAKENALIIEEILKQRIEGMKNEKGEYVSPEFPKLIYVLNENNILNGGKYDYLTNLAIDCSLKGSSLEYISKNVMKQKTKGMFNQGSVSINLAQIGILAGGNEEVFWSILEERLDICFEALMCRHHALLGTVSDISPIHWQHGGISRLASGEKIDKILKGKGSSLSLGYVGLHELIELIKGKDKKQEELISFGISVIEKLKNTCKKWENELGIKFMLYSGVHQEVLERLLNVDKEKFGEIKGVTDKTSYDEINQIIIDGNQENIKEELENKLKVQKYAYTGGKLSICLNDIKLDKEFLENVIRYSLKNSLHIGF